MQMMESDLTKGGGNNNSRTDSSSNASSNNNKSGASDTSGSKQRGNNQQQTGNGGQEPKKSRQKQGRKGAGKRRSDAPQDAEGVGGAATSASTGIPLHVATGNSLIGSSNRTTQNDHLASVASPGTNSATFGHLSRQVALGQIVSAEQTQKGQLSADELLSVCKELEERARQCEAQMVQEILEFHSGAKIPKRSLNAALRECVKGCKTSLLDDCIQTVSHLIDANALINSEEQGRTALMIACEAGYIELVRCLLDHQALVNIQDPNKRTALHYAIEAKAQNIDVVQELIKREVPINDPASDGLTPLLLAAQKGHYQIVNILLQAGANLTFQAGDNFDSALHLTCASGDFNTANALLDFAKRHLDRGAQQKFLYLENKHGLKALQLLDLKLAKSPESENLRKMHDLLGGIDHAINAETEEEIQTLLKKEEQQSKQQQSKALSRISSQQNNSSNQSQKASQRRGNQTDDALQSSNVEDIGAFGSEKVKIEVKFDNLTGVSSQSKNNATNLSNPPPQSQSSGLTADNIPPSDTTSTGLSIDKQSKKKGQQNSISSSNNPHNKFGASNLFLSEQDHHHHNPNNHDQDLAAATSDQTDPATPTPNKSADKGKSLSSLTVSATTTGSATQKNKGDGAKSGAGLTSGTPKRGELSEDSQPVVLSQKKARRGAENKQDHQLQQQAVSQQFQTTNSSSSAPGSQQQQQPSSQQSYSQMQQNRQNVQGGSGKDGQNDQVRARTQLKLGEELTTLKGAPFSLLAQQQSQGNNKTQQQNSSSTAKNNNQSEQQVTSQQQHQQVGSSSGMRQRGQQQTQNQQEEERSSNAPNNSHKNSGKGVDSNNKMTGAVQGAIRPQDNNQNSTFKSGNSQASQNTTDPKSTDDKSAPSKQSNDTTTPSNIFNADSGPNATGAWKLEENPQGVLGMSVNLHLPLNLHKSIHTKKAQMDFIMEQSEHRMRSMSQMLQSERESVRDLREQIKGLVLERAEMADQCKAQYAQAKMHYDNFRLLETEVKSTNEIYKDNLAEIGSLVSEIAEKIGKGFSGGGNKAEKQECLGLTKKLDQLQKTLLGQVNKIIADSDAFSQDSESVQAANTTGLFEIQNAANYAIQAPLSHINASPAQMDQYELGAIQGVGAGVYDKQQKCLMDQSNILVDMDAQYDTEASDEQSLAYPEKVYNKLHDEIVLFNLAVKDVMEEIEPIKGVIIGRVQKIMEKSIPNAGIEIYGSHATKLCLQWSDIDIALIPPSKGGLKQSSDVFLNSDSSQGGGRGGYQNQQYGSQRYQTEDWLDRVADELKRDEHRAWLKEIQYIPNTTVPVIKLKCVYFTQAQIEKGNLVLPNGKKSKFPSYVVKEINVDITLITDGHNGIRCVDLVKEYLSESQLIQPIILVLKQMLKTWGYNDAYSGGLSSYALLLMIVSFLQERNKTPQVQEENLGEVLLEFLRFYSQLDIQKFAVACRTPGEPLDATRTNFYQNTDVYAYQFQPRFVIDDPLNVTNNVGKSAFKFHEIQKIMSMVYQYAFTGCFCTCHHRNASRRSCIAHNPNQLHKSPLSPNEHRLVRNPNPDYLMQATASTPPSLGGKSQSAMDEASQNKTASFNQASANSNSERNQIGVTPPLMHTQSQPFSMGHAQQATAFIPQGTSSVANDIALKSTSLLNAQNAAMIEEEPDCACDSVLSRLIYCYKRYSQAFEGLQKPMIYGQGGYNTPQNFLALANAQGGGNGGPSFPYNGGNPSFTRQQLQGQLNFGLLQNLQMGNM